MRTFNSVSEAFDKMFKKSDMRSIGDKIKNNCQRRISGNKTTGKQLKASTISRKKRLGSSTPSTKLREGGGIHDQIKVFETANGVEIGYKGEKHRKFQPKDADITVAELVNIHHNHKSNPRQFLFIGEEERDIIVNTIIRRIIRA
jgi:hypothetical protein